MSFWLSVRPRGFDAWLREDPERDDALWIIPEAEFGNMHDLVEVQGNTPQMRYWPRRS